MYKCQGGVILHEANVNFVAGCVSEFVVIVLDFSIVCENDR